MKALRVVAIIAALAAAAFAQGSFGRGLLSQRPSACQPGDTYFAYDQTPATQNYQCTGVNTWLGAGDDIPGGKVSVNTPKLSHFNAALNNATTSVVILGDGDGQGFFASNRLANSWAALVTGTLQSLYGNHGLGMIPVYNTSNYPWVASGSWTGSTTIGSYDPLVSSSVFSASGTGSAFSSTIAYTLAGVLADSFTVVTYTASDSGNCAVSIDGAAATVLSHSTSATATAVADVVAAPGGYGVHSIAIGPNGSTQKCYLYGAMPTRGATGLQVSNLSLNGVQTSFFGQVTGTAGSLGYLALMSPDMVIVSIGMNDFSSGVSLGTFTTQYTNILNAVQATGASIVIVGQAPRSTSDGSAVWLSYRNALVSLASTYNAVLMDVTTRWKSYALANADGFINTNRPSTAGHSDIANYIVSTLFPLSATVPPPAATVATANGNVQSTAIVYTPNTDMVCAYGGDNKVAKQVVTGATSAANSVITVSSTVDYPIGSNVTLSGFSDSGFNGTYTVTANPTGTTITISLNSLALTYTGGGNPNISLTCTNASDANSTTQRSYVTSYTIPAGTFSTAGKRLKIDTTWKLYTASNVTATFPTFRFRLGATTSYLPNGAGSVVTSASQSGSSIPATFTVTGLGAAGASAPLAADGILTLPGWLPLHWENTNPAYQLYATSSALATTFQAGFAVTGAGGTITYVSGGTATGSGNCLAQATGGTGSGAQGLIGVVSGTISGTMSIGPSFAQTNTGSGYGTTPTSWTLSVPTVGGAATCSGTIVTSGGTLGGAQGNAMQLVSMAVTYLN